MGRGYEAAANGEVHTVRKGIEGRAETRSRAHRRRNDLLISASICASLKPESSINLSAFSYRCVG